MTDHEVQSSNVTRRLALGRLVLGGGVVVASAVAGATAAAAGGGSGAWKRQSVIFDIACLGETWRDSDVNYADNASDFRGMPFSVEGWIYPENHIQVPGDGFVPTQDGSVGRWLCRGTTLVHAGRIEPHVQTTQEFVFGPMTLDHLFADDNLTTSGTEGTAETVQVAPRAVIGGTGIYLGATGQVIQERNGSNTSAFADGTGSAPNFRMRFDLLLPNP